MEGEVVAESFDVFGNGGAEVANFAKLGVEIFGLSGAIDRNEGLELALIGDEIVDKGGFGGDEIVLIFYQFGGAEAVFYQANVEGGDEFADDGFVIATKIDASVRIGFLDGFEVVYNGATMSDDGFGLSVGNSASGGGKGGRKR